MKKLTVLAVHCMIVTMAVVTPARSQAPNQVRTFMRQKLDRTQQVLEGVVVENFDSIAKNAQALSLLSQEATWQVLQTPDYLQHSIEFRRAADALTAAAKRRNIDAAALAYVDMTMRCIQCHKYVRGVRMAKAP
jgi:hypothetical protein